MGQITNASSLNLSNQGLTKIPEYIFKCKNLKLLNLGNNKPSCIPIELFSIKTLKTLDLSNNSIKQVNSKLSLLNKLEVLNLNNNSIKSLPKQLGDLKSLKSLHISGNQLETLPEEILRLTKLRTLNFSKNKFVEFPEQIIKLNSLTKLWIGQNSFNYIPLGSLSENLPQLSSFYCYNSEQKVIENLDSFKIQKIRGNTINELKLLKGKVNPIENTEIKNPIKRNKIFISYSHREPEFKDEVILTINAIKNTFSDIKIEDWDDNKILPGNPDWEKEIKKALNETRIAILIMSRYFLASDFIMKKELPQILNDANNEGTIILILNAGQCDIKGHAINKYQHVNAPEKPLQSLNKHEENGVYKYLSETIRLYLTKTD